jgi:hypothetical protein
MVETSLTQNIKELALLDPTIAACFKAAEMTDTPYVEMIEGAVILLLDQNVNLKKQLETYVYKFGPITQ